MTNVSIASQRTTPATTRDSCSDNHSKSFNRLSANHARNNTDTNRFRLAPDVSIASQRTTPATSG